MLSIMPFLSGIFNLESHEVELGVKPITNPLKGWMAPAGSSELQQEATLAFVLIRWKEIEPKEGKFDFAALEENKNFAYWKEKGARIVLRMVCDYPVDEKENRTIPDWLYKKIKGDGDWYDNSYGKGFSPNYFNKTFIQSHKNLIKALGQRYNKDESVAYIQLGSIGHWGEWHVNHDEGIKKLPQSNITDQYVKHYMEYFPDKVIMMRRPYSIAEKNKFGLFNDSFADKESTQDWLSWIAKGYTSEQNGEKFKGMPEYWKYAPSGGEIAAYTSIESYLTKHFAETHEQMINSHTTFLGPNAPTNIEAEGTLQQNIDKMTADMGYCFTVNRYVEYSYLKDTLNLAITWDNIGIAPMYQNWPIEVTLVNEMGEVCAADYPSTDITKWYPGENKVKAALKIGFNLMPGKYKICVAIIDPITEKPGVKLALKEEISDSTYVIGEYEKEDVSK